jgi:ankyrin repeat protein
MSTNQNSIPIQGFKGLSKLTKIIAVGSGIATILGLGITLSYLPSKGKITPSPSIENKGDNNINNSIVSKGDVTVKVDQVPPGLKNNSLFIAIEKGGESGVKSALEDGADVNGVNYLGRTPLMLATRGTEEDVQFGEGKTEKIWFSQPSIITSLLERNADINAQDDDGYTALMHGTSQLCNFDLNRNLSKIASEASPPSPDNNIPDASIDMRKYFKDILRDSPLYQHLGKKNGLLVESVRLLIKAKADVNIRDKQGNSALMLACKCDQINGAKLPLNARHFKGVFSVDTGVIEKLISGGALVNNRNNSNQSALSMAKNSGLTEIVNLLTKAGAKE